MREKTARAKAAEDGMKELNTAYTKLDQIISEAQHKYDQEKVNLEKIQPAETQFSKLIENARVWLECQRTATNRPTLKEVELKRKEVRDGMTRADESVKMAAMIKPAPSGDGGGGSDGASDDEIDLD